MSAQTSPTPDPLLRQQLDQLKCSGVILLPVHADKSAVHRKWNRRQTRVPRCLKHLLAGGRLGVIPATAGFTVIDVDRGDPGQLMEIYPPAAVTQTPSGGVHLWYRDNVHRPRRTWETHGCSGDIISADAYVVLWEGVAALDRVMESGPEVTYPAEMIDLAPRAEPGDATPRTPLDHSSAAQSHRGKRSGISRARVPRVRAMVAKGMRNDGHAQSEIAKVLGRSTRTVRSYMGWDVPAAVDWRRGLEELKKLERIERTDRRRLPRAAERAEANLVGGIGGSGHRCGGHVATGIREATRAEGRDDRRTADAGELAACSVHGLGYRHWDPPSVRAVQLFFYRLRALVCAGDQSQQYGLAARALQKYLRGITRRSCQWRTAAVEAQAECFAQAASDAIDAGTPIVEIMTLIQDRQYVALYQLEARLA